MRWAASWAKRAELAPSERAQMTTFWSGPTTRDALQSWQGSRVLRWAEPRTETLASFHIRLDIHGCPTGDGREDKIAGARVCGRGGAERGGEPGKQLLEIQP